MSRSGEREILTARMNHPPVISCIEESKLRAEVERMTDVLDKTARECAEEEIRLGSCINDMNNDNRELRAEIEHLRSAMLEAQTLCANDRGGNAIYLIRDALAGKEAPHDHA
jgi:hypothetical protein